MDQLPIALLLEIVEYLNPRERQRFSSSSKELRMILPIPLQLKITSKQSGSALQERLFVALRDNPQKMLLDHEELIFEKDYLFWTYDYERENKVYLSRHGQEKLNTEDMQYIFGLGLRPKQPTQFVRVKGGQAGTKVQFGQDLGLDIGGVSEIEHTPDSKVRMYLASKAPAHGTVEPLWYVMQQKWGNNEILQIYRCQDHLSTINDITGLIVHAIADIIDGICSLYSPRSLKGGRAAYETYHANINFRFWIVDGLLCFQAMMPQIPFAFGVPMLEEDNAAGIEDPVDYLRLLLKRNSGRWFAVKHYMARAADVWADGISILKVEDFMRTVKDHESYTIILDESSSLVYIQVEDGVVQKQIADCPQKEEDVWEFLIRRD